MDNFNKVINKEAAVIQIVAAAPGGVIKGVNSLQRIAYLLEVARVGYGFKFWWKKAVPFSEDVQKVIDSAKYFKKLKIIHTKTKSGVEDVNYKTFTPYMGSGGKDDFFQVIVTKASECIPKQLDLATTAAFYHWWGAKDPWGDIKSYRSVASYGKVFAKSQRLYERLRSIQAFSYLPEIPASTKLAAKASVEDTEQNAGLALVCSGEW